MEIFVVFSVGGRIHILIESHFVVLVHFYSFTVHLVTVYYHYTRNEFT